MPKGSKRGTDGIVKVERTVKTELEEATGEEGGAKVKMENSDNSQGTKPPLRIEDLTENDWVEAGGRRRCRWRSRVIARRREGRESGG